ncbi:MAG: sugar ABC transporter, partial [Synergistetes bacterium]|nr:sugar ABC transporter [Synergistota bacterium]
MTKISTAILIVILLFLTIPTVSCGQPYKVTIMFSYSKDLLWDTNVLKGIKSALKDMPIDYTYFYMDTKQPRIPTYMKEIASKAIKLIQKVKPDLVITMDDNALRLVAKNFY